jgi:prophage regulatory protein
MKFSQKSRRCCILAEDIVKYIHDRLAGKQLV